MQQTKIIVTVPTRENWHLFCSEPELTRDEHHRWWVVRKAVTADEELREKLIEATLPEHEAFETAKKERYTPDWTDMVHWADARRRFVRANLKAYENVALWPEGAAR